MAQIIGGYAASHSPLMLTNYDKADPVKADLILKGFHYIKQQLDEHIPDAIIVISDDHFKSFFLDNMPMFCIGIHTCRGHGDFGLPQVDIPIDEGLASDILKTALLEDFDLNYSLELKLDHGHIQPLYYVRPQFDIPIVPIVINCCAPPLPTLRRCYQFGQMIRKVLNKYSDEKRVAIIASGALSHWPPIPKVDVNANDDDSMRMKHLMIHGKATSAEDEEFRKNRVVKITSGRVNENWDQQILSMILENKIEDLISMSYEEIEKYGGNGGQEIRNWIALIGIMEGYQAKVIEYQPVPEWITGMGIVEFTDETYRKSENFLS